MSGRFDPSDLSSNPTMIIWIFMINSSYTLLRLSCRKTGSASKIGHLIINDFTLEMLHTLMRLSCRKTFDLSKIWLPLKSTAPVACAYPLWQWGISRLDKLMVVSDDFLPVLARSIQKFCTRLYESVQFCRSHVLRQLTQRFDISPTASTKQRDMPAIQHYVLSWSPLSDMAPATVI